MSANWKMSTKWNAQRIMCNYLYKYLITEKVLYSKHFGFQTCLSTEYTIVKLVDQI